MVYFSPLVLPCGGPSCTGYSMLCIHDQVGSHEIQGTQLHHSVKCNNLTHKLTQLNIVPRGNSVLFFSPYQLLRLTFFEKSTFHQHKGVNCLLFSFVVQTRKRSLRNRPLGLMYHQDCSRTRK